MGSVTSTYTAGGRRVSQTDAAGNATVTHYATDGTMLPVGSELGGLTELRFEYDPSYPVLIARERGPVRDPIRTEYGFDRYLHQTRIDTTRAGNGERETKNYSYDGSGHRLSATLIRNGETESALSWTYDEFGRTKTKTYEIDGQAFLAPKSSRSIEWGYTPTGQLGFIKYPSGNQASYRYDADGHLESITSGFGPRAVPLAAFDNPDASGRYLTTTIGGDLRIRHRYDTGRESWRGIESPGGGFEETYAYDNLGRLKTTARALPGGVIERRRLGYDVRSLLTGESVGGATEPRGFAYTYDALGRRTAKTVTSGAGKATQSYRYDAGNRVIEATGGNQTATVWDAFGRPAGDHRDLAFTWGLNDELLKIELPDGRREEMRFDADGQRVARLVDGNLEAFFSSDLSGDVYSHRQADGSYLDVVRAPDGGVVALLSGEGEVIPWGAAKGDTRLQAGNLGGSDQSAFGEAGATDLAADLGFHQSWASALTPLRFAGVRVYDPELGRFLTPDPLGLQAAADPNDAIDLFRYAHNNPVAVRDSTGYLGVTPPTPTTIIVDGIMVETYNVNAWDNGTIRVANQAAYIAGVRAGIKQGLAAGLSLDDAVQYALGNRSLPQSARPTGIFALHGLMHGIAGLFGNPSSAAGTIETVEEDEAHLKATEEATAQAQGGGPADGLLIDENGKIVRSISGADPQSRNYWLRVDGPNGEELLGADSQQIVQSFFAENPEYQPLSPVFEAGDTLTVEVSPPVDNRHGVIRFGSGFFNAAGGAVAEAWYFMIHDNFGAQAHMVGWYQGFQPKSGFWAASNTYMDQGYSYGGALAMVMSDGMFYGTIGAVLAIDQADGDWESVGENTFALSAFVAGAALGGARAGLSTATPRSGLLLRRAATGSGSKTVIMAGPDGPEVSAGARRSNASLVAEALDNPLVFRPEGQARAVFFGDGLTYQSRRLRGWMDDGPLRDSLHIGGFHGNSGPRLTFTYQGRKLSVSPGEVAAAVERAVPGTTLATDHLTACCSARPGAAGGLFARARGRLVFGYDEVVGLNGYGRYLMDEAGAASGLNIPLPGQYMILLDSAGQWLNTYPFRGMRSKGGIVP